MKPIALNLAAPKKSRDRAFSVLVIIAVLVALVLGAVTLYEYLANRQMILACEKRIAALQNQAARQAGESARLDARNQERLIRIRKDVAMLTTLVTKSRFPVLTLLTDIEKRKPGEVDISELVFSDNLVSVVIKASAEQADPAAAFIENMKMSPYVDTLLSRKEITPDRSIQFELTLTWIGSGDDKNP
jgi:hypothetical protein